LEYGGKVREGRGRGTVKRGHSRGRKRGKRGGGAGKTGKVESPPSKRRVEMEEKRYYLHKKKKRGTSGTRKEKEPPPATIFSQKLPLPPKGKVPTSVWGKTLPRKK